MGIEFDCACQSMRGAAEALESGEGGYTRDFEAFIDYVFEPLLYNEFESEDIYSGSGDNLEDSRIEEEFEYWVERFGEDNDGWNYREGRIERFVDKIESMDSGEFDTVIAPAVGGIPYGILAKDILEADEFGIMGYEDKVRNGPRPVSFSTVDEVKGGILISDDRITSGASIAGVAEEIDREEVDSIYGTNRTVETHKVVRHPTTWKVKNELGLSDEDPDWLIKSNWRGVDVQRTWLPLDRMAKKGAVYAGSTAMVLAGLNGLKNGFDPTTSAGYTALGLIGLSGEFGLDLFSEEILEP